MEESFSEGTVRRAVVARIFGKEHGECEILKKLRRSLVGRIGGESFGIALHSLAKGTVAVRSLVESGVEAGIEKRDRIERILDKEDKFISGTKRAKKNTGLVLRGVHCFSFERARKESHSLFHRAVVVFEADNGRGFDARCARVLQGLHILSTRLEITLRTAHFGLRRTEGARAKDSHERGNRQKAEQVVPDASQRKFSIPDPYRPMSFVIRRYFS